MSRLKMVLFLVFSLTSLSATAIGTPYSGLKYFGYYSCDATCMEEVKGSANMIQINLKMANSAQILETKALMDKAAQLGMKIIIRGGVNAEKYRTPEGRAGWEAVYKLLKPYTDHILAFYPSDEPYMRAWVKLLADKGLPSEHWHLLGVEEKVAAILKKKLELEESAAILKRYFPDKPVIFIESSLSLDERYWFPPKNYDWIGFNRYGCWENCKDGKGIRHWVSFIKKKLKNNQRIMVVPQGFIFDPSRTCTRIPEATEVAFRALTNQYRELALTDPAVIGVMPWFYNVRKDVPGYCGLQGLSQKTKDLWKRFGRSISNQVISVQGEVHFSAKDVRRYGEGFVGNSRNQGKKIQKLSLSLKGAPAGLSLVYQVKYAAAGGPITVTGADGKLVGGSGQEGAISQLSLSLRGPNAANYDVFLFCKNSKPKLPGEVLKEGVPCVDLQGLTGFGAFVRSKLPQLLIMASFHSQEVNFHDGQVVASPQGKLTGFKMRLENFGNLGISYKVRQKSLETGTSEETEWLTGGRMVGGKDPRRRMEAIGLRLTGSSAKKFNVSIVCKDDQGKTHRAKAEEMCGSARPGVGLKEFGVEILVSRWY